MSCSPPGHSNPHLTFTNSDCDTYLQPGFITTHVSNMTQNYWTSYNPNCPRAPHFMQDVLERKPLPWLQGKTFLLVGDSVDRNAVNYFFELVNSSGQYERTWDNIIVTARDGSQYEAPTQHLRICRVDEYNFEMVMFFHYGLEDADVYAERSVDLPRLLDERIPLLKTLIEFYGRTPDMISITSGTHFPEFLFSKGF